MSATPSYEDLQLGFLNLEHLIYRLDYAMWLICEYDAQPDTTLVSLIKKPRLDESKAIDECLLHHREELIFRSLRCTQCSAEFSAYGRRRPTCEFCDANLEEIRHEPSDKYLREQAGMRLAREGLLVSRIAAVSSWITYEFAGGSYPDELERSVNEITQRLRATMTEHIDETVFQLARTGISLHLNGRRDLIPKGRTLEVKYEDYLSVRDKLTTSYNELRGLGRGHPEFVEVDEEPRRPRTFPPPIPAPVATVADLRQDSEGREGHLGWGQGRNDEANETGLVQQPKDPSAYSPASDIIANYHEIVADIKELHNVLNEHPEIRRWKPSTQRLRVHLGDWARFIKNRTTLGDGSFDDPAVIEQRKGAARKLKERSSSSTSNLLPDDDPQ